MFSSWTKILNLSSLTLLLALYFCIYQKTQAAPLPPEKPGFSDEKSGLLLWPGKTGWTFFDENDFAAEGRVFVARPIGSHDTGSSLSLRVDQSNLDSVKKYTEKWLKDYPKFGFDLQLSQEATYGELKGYEIELISKTPQKTNLIRQFIAKNQGDFLIFTCSGEAQNFQSALKNCQEILKSAKIKAQQPTLLPK